jgi:hypothetical protein
MAELINKVAQSQLITLNLEDHIPTGEMVGLDLKNYLFRELLLKEKDFRESMKTHNWDQYTGKHLAVFCSTDAIVPVWAFMLVAIYAEPHTKSVFYGSKEELKKILFAKSLSNLDIEKFRDKRIVIKGCGEKEVPPFAYVEVTRLLRPVVKTLMYGEPCSTVPLYKRK